MVFPPHVAEHRLMCLDDAVRTQRVVVLHAVDGPNGRRRTSVAEQDDHFTRILDDVNMRGLVLARGQIDANAEAVDRENRRQVV
jgi:hypothetical protein